VEQLIRLLMSDAVKMCAFLMKKEMLQTCLVVIIARLHVCFLKRHKHLKHNVKTNNIVIPIFYIYRFRIEHA